jgi:hypothetical protein
MESLARRAWRLRIRPTITDPWTLLVCAGGGGLAWALSVPPAGAVAIGVGMLGAAGAVSVLREEGPIGRGPQADPLTTGTEQAALIASLDSYVGDLKRLRERADLPGTVQDVAVESLVAATGTQDVAKRVARGLDGLDDAIARTKATMASGPVQPGAGSRSALQRMSARRDALLGRLRDTVAGVQEVYTKLLELSATADLDSLSASDGSGTSEIAEVSASLDSLRSALAALDADARRPLPGAPA